MSSEVTQFKPGQSGNPLGKAKLPSELAEARKTNRNELERVAGELLFGANKEEIQARFTHKDAKGIEIGLAKIWAEMVKKGDEKRLLMLLGCAGIVIKQAISLDGGEDADGNAKPIQLQRVDLFERIKQLEEAKNGKA